jgi:hypothetical protein
VYRVEPITNSEQAFAVAGFIADWILAHGDDGLGDTARLSGQLVVRHDDKSIAGVIAQVDEGGLRLLW